MSSLVSQIASNVLAQVITIAEANKAQILSVAASENVTVEKLISDAVTAEVNTFSPLLKSIVTPMLTQAIAAYAPILIASLGTEEEALFTLLIEQLQNEQKALSAS